LPAKGHHLGLKKGVKGGLLREMPNTGGGSKGGYISERGMQVAVGHSAGPYGPEQHSEGGYRRVGNRKRLRIRGERGEPGFSER